MDAEAQCAMCKAANESALDEDSGIGINEGIIYLMGIPYILLGVLGYLFFRKQIGGFFREFADIHK
ncbi:MAG: hypothetical protein EA392_05085 [Cryomorphaceae bacterium]|nr:MAG: hypothetical protein EA392_05085 [Cryomorphaceae bacterium]